MHVVEVNSYGICSFQNTRESILSCFLLNLFRPTPKSITLESDGFRWENKSSQANSNTKANTEVQENWLYLLVSHLFGKDLQFHLCKRNNKIVKVYFLIVSHGTCCWKHFLYLLDKLKPKIGRLTQHSLHPTSLEGSAKRTSSPWTDRIGAGLV